MYIDGLKSKVGLEIGFSGDGLISFFVDNSEFLTGRFETIAG